MYSLSFLYFVLKFILKPRNFLIFFIRLNIHAPYTFIKQQTKLIDMFFGLGNLNILSSFSLLKIILEQNSLLLNKFLFSSFFNQILPSHLLQLVTDGI